MITLFSVAVHLLFKSKSSTCHLDPLLWPSEAEASLACMIHKLQLGCINVCSDVCEAFEDSRCYKLLMKRSFRRSVIRSCEGLSAGDGSGHSPPVWCHWTPVYERCFSLCSRDVFIGHQTILRPWTEVKQCLVLVTGPLMFTQSHSLRKLCVNVFLFL